MLVKRREPMSQLDDVSIGRMMSVGKMVSVGMTISVGKTINVFKMMSVGETMSVGNTINVGKKMSDNKTMSVCKSVCLLFMLLNIYQVSTFHEYFYHADLSSQLARWRTPNGVS